MRKCALPSLPRLSEMSPWCVCGGLPLFVRPMELGQENAAGRHGPKSQPRPRPHNIIPHGAGATRAMLGSCPGWGYLNDHPAVGPPHAPLPRDAAVPSACPRGRAPSPAPDSCPCRGVGWPPYVPAESLAFMGLPPNPHLSSCSPSQSPHPIKSAPC